MLRFSCNSSLSSKETERERLDILRQILLENYIYMVDEFYIKKHSQVAGETTFKIPTCLRKLQNYIY